MSLALPVLAPRFRSREHYNTRTGQQYALLPFRFLPLDEQRYILTNYAGEHLVIQRARLEQFVRHELPMDSQLYLELKSRHFLMDGDSTVAIDLLAAKFRTKLAFVSQLTSLFLFVTTLRCEHSCPYCQVSRQTQDKSAFDMTPDIADRAVDFMFQTPSPAIKVEFQGGESLLNFELVEHITRRVEARNQTEVRDISFVIATTLSMLEEKHLAFFKEHGFHVSTSLDGPEGVHNLNRPRPGRDSHQRASDGIRRVREALGHDRISAIMTTTEASLAQPREIIEEYVRQGFRSIFLRSISPYGFAVKTGQSRRYLMDRWLEFYKDALRYTIELNQRGMFFREEYATIILRKILTPYSTGYVDLQSPAGAGISCLVFNYDGDIYASDEARMLHEMGDETFRLGNVMKNSFAQVLQSDKLVSLLAESMSESVPMCSDCGVQPYCGSDPVFHHAVGGDRVGFKPSSDFCHKNMSVIRHLIALLEDDREAASVLRSWV
jgi:uncharacterized protein